MAGWRRQQLKKSSFIIELLLIVFFLCLFKTLKVAALVCIVSFVPQWEKPLVLLPPHPSAVAGGGINTLSQMHPLISHTKIILKIFVIQILDSDWAFPPLNMLALPPLQGTYAKHELLFPTHN